MMKLMMILVFVLSLATAGAAWLAQVRSIASATTVISGIADLRQENNLEKCQMAETHASRQMRKIRDSFVPIIWLGGITAALGLAGILVSGRKRKDDKGQQPAAPYSEPAARSPQG